MFFNGFLAVVEVSDDDKETEGETYLYGCEETRRKRVSQF